MNAEANTQTAHEFSTSGCRYQWHADHNETDCWDAFLQWKPGGWR